MINKLQWIKLKRVGAFLLIFSMAPLDLWLFGEAEDIPGEKVPQHILVMDVRQRQVVNWLNHTNFHKKLGFHVPPKEEEANYLRQMRGIKQNLLSLRKRFQAEYKEHRVLLLKGDVDVDYYEEEKRQSEEDLKKINTRFQAQYQKFKAIYDEALKKCPAKRPNHHDEDE